MTFIKKIQREINDEMIFVIFATFYYQNRDYYFEYGVNLENNAKDFFFCKIKRYQGIAGDFFPTFLTVSLWLKKILKC